MEAAVGLIATETGAVTVTVALADLVESATLVAFTVYAPAVVGAVYSPELEIVPPVADHVTALLPLPLIVAENCCVAPDARLTNDGAIATDTTGAETVTVAVADLVASTILVAVMLYVPALPDAV